MKNKVFIRSIGLVVFLIVVIGIGAFLLQKRNAASESAQQKQDVVKEVEKIPSATTKTYSDESGFTFVYPNDVVVSKKENTDSATYANIEITSNVAPGTITLRVEDTKVKSVEEWTAKNISATQSASKDIKLGNLSAREITSNNKIVSLALDQGILFRLEVIPDKEKSYWMSVYNTILSSFSFAMPQAAAPASNSGGGDDVSVEEDVVE